MNGPLGKLWEDEQLAMLAIFKYAPRCSRFNPIERAWSKMTKDLSNLILDPDCEIISKDHASTALQHEKINIEKFREVFPETKVKRSESLYLRKDQDILPS